MTDQYAQPNINTEIPRNSRTVTGDTQATPDDDLIVVENSANADIELYSAQGVPGNRVVIKAPNAGSNPVTVLPLGGSGQTIDGSASVVLTADDESLTVKSDGENWQVIGQVGASSGGGGLVPACIPGPGVLLNVLGPPLPGTITFSNILFRTPFGIAGVIAATQAPGSPFALDGVVVDVETSTLEVGATLIDRIPYGLGGGPQPYTYTVSNIVQGVNPNDPNLTRFTFDFTGTWGSIGSTLAVAFGVQNPSGGTNFAGYVVFDNFNPA